MSERQKIRITGAKYGYAHVKISGEFDEDVTREELREFIREGMEPFGGRDTRIDMDARTFSYIRHTD